MLMGQEAQSRHSSLPVWQEGMLAVFLAAFCSRLCHWVSSGPFLPLPVTGKVAQMVEGQ